MSGLFRSSVRTVKPEWIDYNGHLNMAYYNVLFDEGADEVYPLLGFGPDYRTRTGCTTYTAEFHVRYLRELHAGDPVTVSFQLIDHDAKRFHSYQELRHTDGWVAATAEAMTLHIDQRGPKVAPMPADVLVKVAAMATAQADIARPAHLGRPIGIPKRATPFSAR